MPIGQSKAMLQCKWHYLVAKIVTNAMGQGGRCWGTAGPAVPERSGSSPKGRTSNIRYFVAKLSIVAIYALFEWPPQSFLQKSSYFGSVFNESQLAFEGLPTKVSLLSESPLSDSFRRAFVEFPESFQRAFGELSESFQRAFGELSESFRRAFGELSQSLLLQSFQRAFVEPAFVEFSESFWRAFGELS